MAIKRTYTAGRFAIFLNGVSIAHFSELQGITTSADVASKKRGLLAHELTHLVQQNEGKRNVNILLTKPDASRSTLQKLRSSAGRQIKLTAYNKLGATTLALKVKIVKVETDVMQQEWTLTFESIQRAPL